MKTITVKFVDFWPSFDVEDNTFVQILSERYAVEFSDDPDFIFYSVFGNEYLNYDCVRIFFTGENLRPDFNLCDYAIGFDWMIFEDRYLRCPLYYLFQYNKDFQLSLVKHRFRKDELSKKTGFCNFIYSNSNAQTERDYFFRSLGRYKNIDSGGRHLNNIGGLVGNKLEFQSKYKFSIAFENTSTPGYTTEKIIQAFAAQTIPIYWGNPNIDKEFNTKSFINCHEYNNFDEVIERIIELDYNDELYLEVMREPIILTENLETSVYKNLEEFLFSIFEQERETAFRRLRYFHGVNYENKIKHYIKSCDELRHIQSSIQFRFWRFVKNKVKFLVLKRRLLRHKEDTKMQSH